MRPKNRIGAYAFWIGAVLLAAAWWNNVAGPPPPKNVAATGISSFVFFSLLTAWAYSVNGSPEAKEVGYGNRSTIRSISSDRM